MKIAFIEPHLAVCGGIRRIHYIANGLVDLGHEVIIFVPDWVFDTQQTGGWLPQNFKVLPERKIPEIKADIVIFNEETQYELAQKMDASCRIFYALHWSVLHKDYNILRNCYRGGFNIIANSNWTADCMYLETGIRPPIHLGGIDSNMFHPVEVKKEYDFLGYGSSREWKGRKIFEAICFSFLNENKKDGSPYVAKMFGDNSNIQQEKMAKEYSKARIFISTSWYEGWNWPALEAMSCGVPVVMSDDGGSGDYAYHGFNCLKFASRDVVGATVMVRKALENQEMMDTLSKNGIETAKKFNWKKSVEDFYNLLKIYYERSITRTGQAIAGSITKN